MENKNPILNPEVVKTINFLFTLASFNYRGYGLSLKIKDILPSHEKLFFQIVLSLDNSDKIKLNYWINLEGALIDSAIDSINDEP